MNKKSIIVIALLVVILIVAGVITLNVLRQNEREAVLSSDAGRAFSASSTAAYTDLKGNPVVLTEYVGRTLVVFSWASWCPSCSEQLRMFETFATSRPDVAVLAINRAEPATTAERFISFHQLPTAAVTYVLDSRDHFYQTVGGYAAPETVIFDQDGAIAHHFRGDISLDTLTAHIPQ